MPPPAQKPGNKLPPFPSVSKTSLSAFDDCERRWALNYQKGKVPQAIRGDILLEQKLMPYSALVGQVVDDTITAALRHFKRKQEWPKKPLIEGAQQIFSQYQEATATWIRLRKQRQAPIEVRRQPIDRVYFGEPLLSSEKSELVERISNCLETFESCAIREWATEFDVSDWRVPEHDEFTPWFDWEGVPVWAKYDFAIVSKNKSYLVDWKTGKTDKKSSDAASDQLHTYAAFAMREWNVPRDDITLRSVWLQASAENCIHDQPVDVDVLARLYRNFKQRHEELARRLKLVGRYGEGLFEAFPKTGFPNRCKWCQFHSCEGYVENEKRWKEGRGRDEV